MSHSRPTSNIEPSLEPVSGGWHCSHLYYSFDREKIYPFSESQLQEICESMIACLDPAGEEAPLRIQSFVVSGHKADFGVMMLDPDPLKIDRVHQRLMAGILGTALVPGYSFVSLTEISEYVQSPEQYGERLVAEGQEAGSDVGDQVPTGVEWGHAGMVRRAGRLSLHLPPRRKGAPCRPRCADECRRGDREGIVGLVTEPASTGVRTVAWERLQRVRRRMSER